MTFTSLHLIPTQAKCHKILTLRSPLLPKTRQYQQNQVSQALASSGGFLHYEGVKTIPNDPEENLVNPT
jgi:hypothetical protein